MIASTQAVAWFRHDPTKSVLGKSSGSFFWHIEPAVCGHRRLTYYNSTLDRTIDVPVSATPAVVNGIGVIVASDDGFVRFFDPTLTQIYWERRLKSSVYASLLVDHERSRVLVAATNGHIFSFDLRGNVAWATKTGVQVCATPTKLLDSEVVVVAAFGSRILGLDLRDGSIVFDRPVPAPWHAEYGGQAAHRDPYASPAATSEGTVIVGCAEFALCFSADGTELWRHEIGRAIKSSPAVIAKSQEVVLCSMDGRCSFLDTRSGELRAEIFLGSQITGSPAVSGSTVAVGTRLGNVVGLSTITREMVWESRQGAPREYTSLTVLPDGNFIATSDSGNIVCLRACDGAFLWESSQILGLPNHEPGMDITPVAGYDGHMYCASYSGNLYQFRFPTKPPEV